jgi:hypothetical protein
MRTDFTPIRRAKLRDASHGWRALGGSEGDGLAPSRRSHAAVQVGVGGVLVGVVVGGGTMDATGSHIALRNRPVPLGPGAWRLGPYGDCR